MFVGVAYWTPMQERMPGLFINPLNADQTAFAQVQLFLPTARLLQDVRFIGDPRREFRWSSFGPRNRDLWNQNWSVQMVPATAANIPSILQTPPPAINVTVPNLGGISVDDFRRLNTH